MSALRALGLLFAAAGLAAPPLEIIEAIMQQLEDGQPVALTHKFVPGETVFFSCRAGGFQTSKEKRISLTFHIEAVDPGGTPIMEPIDGKIDTELAPEDKAWKPKIARSVFVPPLADSGTYKIKVTVKDALGGAQAIKEIPFMIEGRRVDASQTLVVRNLAFYRGEDDPKPLGIAAYRPGDAVWARFDLTGYMFGPGNRIDVAYSVTVTAAEGRVLFRQKEATVEQSESFYPKRYLPCGLSLSLQQNISPGEYTLEVATEDRIGKQTYQSKATFKVE
ncbi:MAG: hypothetical protein ACRD8O_17120 [Bryobacteraceae bacterium]